MLIRELTERQRDPSGKFLPGDSKYGQEGKPEWFDRAVELKKANPDITYADISRAVGGGKAGAGVANLAYWLTGQDRGKNQRIKRSGFPFKPEDFPNVGNRKYSGGAKPKWYDQALQMAKAGETFRAIGIKLGVNARNVGKWLVKGQRYKSGTLVNPDAELEPRNIVGPKIDPQLKADVENLIKDPKLEDADIVELIADAYGTAEAKKVKDMLPALRQKLNPGTQVIDKTRTGNLRDPDITGLVQEAPMTYGQEGKPEWFDRAVKMKLDNPSLSTREIAKQIGVSRTNVLYWLTGKSNYSKTKGGKMLKRPPDSFPFKPEDFPTIGNKKYFDGAKPEWYDQALQMAKAGEQFKTIGKKFGVSGNFVASWLVKGRKNHGKIVNPDAELEPRLIRGQKLDVNLLNDFIEDGYTDEEIIELVADDKGPKIASQVRDMLPVLRKKLNPPTQVIDKTRTGVMKDPDITGLVQ